MRIYTCLIGLELLFSLGTCKKKSIHPEQRWIQNEIVGSVVLDMDDSPIDSVRVFIIGRKRIVLTSFKDNLLAAGFTDKEGKFKVNHLFPSDYRFSAKAILIDNRRNYRSQAVIIV